MADPKNKEEALAVLKAAGISDEMARQLVEGSGVQSAPSPAQLDAQTAALRAAEEQKREALRAKGSHWQKTYSR